jgi:hypothetical protein
MRLSLVRFHWLRFLGAIFALVLAIIYLMESEEIALLGFALIALVAAVICIKIRKGTLPAICDLCRSKGTMRAEYGPGFSNARLILNCPQCGRVINKAQAGMQPGIE